MSKIITRQNAQYSYWRVHELKISTHKRFAKHANIQDIVLVVYRHCLRCTKEKREFSWGVKGRWEKEFYWGNKLCNLIIIHFPFGK